MAKRKTRGDNSPLSAEAWTDEQIGRICEEMRVRPPVKRAKRPTTMAEAAKRYGNRKQLFSDDGALLL